MSVPALPDFLAIAREAHARAGSVGAAAVLDRGRVIAARHGLTDVLRGGGSLVFPHASFETCGHQIAAAVHACLDCGADRVIALGVLHARTPELRARLDAVTAGQDAEGDPLRGFQGPGLDAGDKWRGEWSLAHFEYLWNEEAQRRGGRVPDLVLRYPFLVGARPETLPGVADLQDRAKDAAVVATMDAFHHGIGYGTPADEAIAPEDGGLDLANERITEGLGILGEGRLRDFAVHCAENKSDGRDVGQVLHHLRGPLRAAILDLLADDSTAAYGEPPPTWVACALVAMRAAVTASRP